MADDIRVLLVCGTGASSGFMAANMRKAVAAHGYNIKVTARSESEIENFINETDVVMIGPHLSYVFDDIDSFVGDADVTAILMRPEYYSSLDGEAAIQHLVDVLNEDA
ncbi:MULTISPECIES: PTS sugar transporter subunit IIB [Actinomyces]|jgi:PTS system cellobiose-specific IIB component|uniref:Phosphotransferase system eiib component type 2/3 n=1 Tax=Actinomyces glycerinitolerans TaxID=1892869 RepID=A0A1M4S3H6_9ACTO|nr:MULTISPECIES: PTS sugar transporter subunit IIB [Actinomyces]RAX22843.1 PTS sugar transporter subunit IIB [Actinomyces sp. Z3]RAX24243.1 PTS sugar transporter subunit IIB [Actinomyces sp. Z5]SHE26784.1 phosphotransferase system eiib component type 2/3 [Actinomyces glycerinitolerans]